MLAVAREVGVQWFNVENNNNKKTFFVNIVEYIGGLTLTRDVSVLCNIFLNYDGVLLKSVYNVGNFTTYFWIMILSVSKFILIRSREVEYFLSKKKCCSVFRIWIIGLPIFVDQCLPVDACHTKSILWSNVSGPQFSQHNFHSNTGGGWAVVIKSSQCS